MWPRREPCYGCGVGGEVVGRADWWQVRRSAALRERRSSAAHAAASAGVGPEHCLRAPKQEVAGTQRAHHVLVAAPAWQPHRPGRAPAGPQHSRSDSAWQTR